MSHTHRKKKNTNVDVKAVVQLSSRRQSAAIETRSVFSSATHIGPVQESMIHETAQELFSSTLWFVSTGIHEQHITGRLLYACFARSFLSHLRGVYRPNQPIFLFLLQGTCYLADLGWVHDLCYTSSPVCFYSGWTDVFLK